MAKRMCEADGPDYFRMVHALVKSPKVGPNSSGDVFGLAKTFVEGHFKMIPAKYVQHLKGVLKKFSNSTELPSDATLKHLIMKIFASNTKLFISQMYVKAKAELNTTNPDKLKQKVLEFVEKTGKSQRAYLCRDDNKDEDKDDETRPVDMQHLMGKLSYLPPCLRDAGVIEIH